MANSLDPDPRIYILIMDALFFSFLWHLLLMSSYNFWQKKINLRVVVFPPFFTKGKTLVTICPLSIQPLLKRSSTLEEKNLLPRRADSFFYQSRTLFKSEANIFCRAAFPESVSILLKYIDVIKLLLCVIPPAFVLHMSQEM